MVAVRVLEGDVSGRHPAPIERHTTSLEPCKGPRRKTDMRATHIQQEQGQSYFLPAIPAGSSQSQDSNVAVILGYYQGEKFISQQLRSIFKQSYNRLSLYISDDLSKDAFDFRAFDLTQAELEAIFIRHTGANLGATRNFLSSLAHICGQYEFYAFCDQDDVWHQNKIEKAIKQLSSAPADMPALYCSSTNITDSDGRPTGKTSPIFRQPASFANALVQNIGGGNTMIFNQAACDLIVNSTLECEVIAHDWWCYQIISGAGGHIYYDPEPSLDYRQHGKNLVGANRGASQKARRIGKLLAGSFRHWNDVNLTALAQNAHLLTAQNRNRLNDFIAARRAPLFQRLYLAKRSGIYRQSNLGSLSLLLGLILNKV